MKCPACDSTKSSETRISGVAVTKCRSCGAIYGTLYLGDSYAVVKPYWDKAPQVEGRDRYFDFTTLGSQGVGRRHGWYNPETGLTTQVG